MKRFIKKGLIYIFAGIILFSFSGCSLIKEEKETFSQKEERERLSHLPEAPSQPDLQGNFPSLDRALVEQYIISKKGRADKEKPRSKMPSFSEDEAAQEFLRSSFPHIDDWNVEYEYHDYYLRNDMYDPMSYSFRDMYLPSSMVILETKEGGDFDRLVLSYFKSYQLLDEGDFFTPREDISFTYYVSWKEEWESSNFSDAEKICDGMYCNAIWFRQEESAVIFPETGERALIVKNVTQVPPAVLSIEESLYSMPFYKNGDRDHFVISAGKEENSKGNLMLYNSHDKTLKGFERAENPYIIPIEGSVFAINNKDELCLFDLDSSNPAHPFKILKGFKNNGVIASVATDRNHPENHALAYSDNSNKWHIVTFTTDGSITNEYPLSIDMAYLYDYDFNFADGIIYLNNRILDDTYRFASNVAAGVDNSCKLIRIDRNKNPMSIYKKPLYYLALTGQEFKSPKDIKNFPEIMERIFDMLENDPNQHFWTEFPNGRISADGMMEYINLMFDVDKATVIANSKSYLKDGSTIEYMPHENLIPASISYSHSTSQAPVWEGEKGYVIFGCIDETTREMKEGLKYKVTIKKDEKSHFGFKFLSMEKIP